MIGAMNLGMTVLATTAHQPRIRAAARGETAPCQQFIHMPERRVTLLAEHGSGRDQQFFMVGSMGTVTIQAIITHRGMFKKKRPSLLGMALITRLVHRVGFEQGASGAAMGIVTVRAGDLPLQQGHMGSAPELRSLVLMTHKAGLIDSVPCQQPRGGEIRHGIMAIRAADIESLVNGTQPVDPVTPLMALQALPVLNPDSMARLVGKPEDAVCLHRITDML